MRTNRRVLAPWLALVFGLAAVAVVEPARGADLHHRQSHELPLLAGRGGVITVDLPDRGRIRFATVVESQPSGALALRGLGGNGERLVVFRSERATFAEVYAGRHHFRSEQAGAELRWERVDPAGERRFDEPMLRRRPLARPARPARAPGAGPSSSPHTIDVLAVHTVGFARRFPNPWQEIERLTFLANTYFANSGIPVVYRLVDVVATTGPAPYPPSSVTMVDDVAEHRERSRADVVVFIDSDGTCAGEAAPFNGGVYQPEGEPPNNVDPDRDAAALLRHEPGCPDFVFAHELGHVLGAGHGIEDSYGPRGYWREYSHGWLCGEALGAYKYASVMHYGRISARGDFFSSPTVTRDGEPCGSDGPTEALRADNARVITEAAPYVAGYR